MNQVKCTWDCNQTLNTVPSVNWRRAMDSCFHYRIKLLVNGQTAGPHIPPDHVGLKPDAQYSSQAGILMLAPSSESPYLSERMAHAREWRKGLFFVSHLMSAIGEIAADCPPSEQGCSLYKPPLTAIFRFTSRFRFPILIVLFTHIIIFE